MITTKLIGKESVAEGTMSFRFGKPDGFAFKAGQTIDITLVNPPETDQEGNSRTFSIAASPEEADLMIATRMRDTAFKRNLKNMNLGTEVQIDGPFGSFSLHENVARPAVFLAGGIGITPFHSIVKDAAARNLPHKIFLFYSNRRPEDAAFLSELAELQSKNSNYKLIATMTDIDKTKEGWTGKTGYINEALIRKYVSASESPIYYLAGPETMVSAMRNILTQMGVSGDDIRFEEFAGY